MENRNMGLKVLVVILCVLVLGLGGYLLYDKVLSDDRNANNENENVNNNKIDNTEDINEEKNLSWINYLLSLHILEAKVTRVRSKDLGDSIDLNNTVTLSMDNLKEALSKLENNKLLKIWSEGKGGPDRDLLTISYENNDQKYELRIWNGTIIPDNLDNNFIKILNSDKYIEKNQEYQDSEGAFYFYVIENYSETIFDKYFK